MTHTENELPTRFLFRKDQPKDFWLGRMWNMKSSEFRKIYNKAVNPYLKENGFKTSGFKALREDEDFYYMVLYSSNKSGGNGGLEIYAHPKGFQTRGEFSWDSSSYKDGYKYIFKQAILLPNGNNWFDVGLDEEEARETCAYMLAGLKKQYPIFANNFKSYPEGLLEITPDNFEDNYLTVYRKFGLSFYGESRYDAAVWLSRFHNFHGSPHFTKFADMALQIMIDACEEKGVEVSSGMDEYIEKLKKSM